MKQDEIIDMARQAGLFTHKEVQPEIEAFAKLVAEREREACESIEYDLAESPAMFATMAEYKSYRNGVEKYREAIRARAQAERGEA